ncbi:hypothetical protein ABZ805_28360 [Saccharopolyspora sp. NPDC047091]|uniref:hypothetical protein n=1 Tax=Saccharopolyspora sp. NPDC047091 TaxID=3155924 RepID=UPI0033F9DBDD
MSSTVINQHALQSSPRRVFHVSELEKLGVSQSTSYRRGRVDGPWTRLLPGIVLVMPGPPTTDDLITAALLRAGPSAMVTGMHAARMHGLDTPDETAPVHVLIPHGKKIQSSDLVRFERTTRPPPPIIIDGIPVAPAARAVMDAARTWQSRRSTEALLVEAIQRAPGCSPRALSEEMERGSRRGTGLPREILRAMTADVRSVAELRVFELIRTSDLPEPSWNTSLFDEGGRYVGMPDAWFDDVGLAVEFDSFAYHSSRADFAATTRRNTRYATHGVAVVQILPVDVMQRPDAALSTIRQAYQAATLRPRPNILVRAIAEGA